MKVTEDDIASSLKRGRNLGEYLATTPAEALSSRLWKQNRPSYMNAYPGFDHVEYGSTMVDFYRSLALGKDFQGISPAFRQVHDLLNPSERKTYVDEARKVIPWLSRQGKALCEPDLIEAVHFHAHAKALEGVASRSASFLGNRVAFSSRVFASIGDLLSTSGGRKRPDG